MKKKSFLFNFLRRINEKFRFVLIGESDLKERFSISLSFLNVVVFVVSAFVVFVVFVIILISYSPLKEYVPGKTSSDLQKQLLELHLRSDSLQLAISQRSLYLQNISAIISGKTIVEQNPTDSVSIVSSSLDFEVSEADSLLRAHVESEEAGSLFDVKNTALKALVFFRPVDGFVSDSYNKKSGHFGTDIVAKKNSPINSVLEGTVVINHWTPSTGYVVGVQHANGFLSLYKHNSLIVKDIGDFVFPGEKIAVIGNTGEFSTGPHLHFELWHNGSPVDSENYIIF